jgi:hypothetical protein
VTNIELVRTLHEILNTGKLELIENVYAPELRRLLARKLGGASPSWR